MVSANVNLLSWMLIGLFSKMEAQQLQVGPYKNACSVGESIVKEEVEKAFAKDKGIAPGLLRLHFHDGFVRGCDGSILIDSTPNNAADKDGPPDGITLPGFEVIGSAKLRIEARCKGVVSCAEILAFAARDATIITRGLRWDVPAGRPHGRVSVAAETIDIPAPFFRLDQINESFTKKGLTQADMVTLAGMKNNNSIKM